MPIAVGSTGKASAHMRWAERYARYNNIPKAVAHFGRALEYERGASFGTHDIDDIDDIQETWKKIEKTREQGQALQKQNNEFKKKTQLVAIQHANMPAVQTYIEAVKNYPRTYEASEEKKIDDLEWEDSLDDEDDFEVKVPVSKKHKNKIITNSDKYKHGSGPQISDAQKKIALEFEEKATQLGVLDQNQKKTKLEFYNYRGAYVRALFTLIATELKRIEKSDEIDAWREKKYKFHEGYENPRGESEGPLLTYPRKESVNPVRPVRPVSPELTEVIDLSSDEEEQEQEPRKRRRK